MWFILYRDRNYSAPHRRYINNHNLKIQADYTSIHRQAAIVSTSGKYATDDQQVRFQVQMLF